MRVFAVSDVHVDYDANRDWIANLPVSEYRNDILILAGDVSDSLSLLQWTVLTLAARFKQVLFVPGNHDLWVIRDDKRKTSLEKFDEVCRVAHQCGASMGSYRGEGLTIVPLLSWYDYSFGEPSEQLREMWMDFRACRWPSHLEGAHIARYFADRNQLAEPSDGTTITFSHFLPRIDVMPSQIPEAWRVLYPVLGSAHVEKQIRALRSTIHVYGHSHVNRRVQLDGVTYVNNAFGYPDESRITAKRLLCVYEN